MSAPVAQTETFAQTTIPPTPTAVAVDTFDPAAAGGRTVVKWYVGLGTGANPQQIDIEKAVVDQFNKSQQSVYLTLQIVDNRVASTTLATGPTQPLASGDKIAIQVVGTVVTALHFSGGNWQQVMSYNTSGDAIKYSAAGRLGLEFRSSTLDDFGGFVSRSSASSRCPATRRGSSWCSGPSPPG